jgi:hypothetical protein
MGMLASGGPPGPASQAGPAAVLLSRAQYGIFYHFNSEFKYETMFYM